MDLGTINVNIEGGLDYPFPPLIPVDQQFDRVRVEDIAATITEELQKVPTSHIVGKSIAITVGSRGIDGLVSINSCVQLCPI